MTKIITVALILAAGLGVAGAADARPRHHGYYGHPRMMMRHRMHHQVYHR